MTDTRTVTGNVTHIDGTAWAAGVVAFDLLEEFVTATGVQPRETHTETTDASGDFSIALAVPDTGTAHYQVTLPDGMHHEFYIGAGAATDIQTILATLTAPTTPSALQTIIDAANKAHIVDTAIAYVAALNDYVRADGTFAVTLPAAVGSAEAICAKNVGVGVITVTADGTDLIDGAATYILVANDRVTLLDADTGVWDVL